jgi:hypothetical protein
VKISYSATRAGLLVGRINRRVHVCNGGSALIGGTPAVSSGDDGAPGAMSISGTTLMPFPDGNFSMSWAMAFTSSYRVGSHEPPQRSVCAIGQLSRN